VVWEQAAEVPATLAQVCVVNVAMFLNSLYFYSFLENSDMCVQNVWFVNYKRIVSEEVPCLRGYDVTPCLAYLTVSIITRSFLPDMEFF